ncbi:putative RhtB family transporter [Vibrio halioticoli NBRC 102217]|uniref:Putative RhtB family transporter n=1 Tax=Vibrio halioticoli NBRC 102217 TaxID=1219072 RepID=V5FQT8_9VIBR|nr:LysE family translocator [Vibrio halioticoli]GAD91052.1 putative RhtB family transporter [Vibrio halioticoli NBRC 102217]
MNELHVLMTLAGIHFLALMSPGPDFALVVQNSTRYGRQTGVLIALGLSMGILTHSILSLTGISYLVHARPQLFFIVQLLGGSYLAYLGLNGLKSIFHQRKTTSTSPKKSKDFTLTSKRQAFTRGFTTNLLNPKALVFFVSLMSTLVPQSMSLQGKFAALVILWSLSFFWFALLAWALSTQRLQQALTRYAKYIDLLCSLLFTILGCTIISEAVIHTLLG